MPLQNEEQYSNSEKVSLQKRNQYWYYVPIDFCTAEDSPEKLCLNAYWHKENIFFKNFDTRNNVQESNT